MSEYVEGGLTDVEDVIRASVQGPSLPSPCPDVRGRVLLGRV
jgi:hypothetical protein